MKPTGFWWRTCMAAESCCVSEHAQLLMMESRREADTAGALGSCAPREAQNLGSRVVREGSSSMDAGVPSYSACSTLRLAGLSPSSSMKTCRSSGSGAEPNSPSSRERAGHSSSRSPGMVVALVTRPRPLPSILESSTGPTTRLGLNSGSVYIWYSGRTSMPSVSSAPPVSSSNNFAGRSGVLVWPNPFFSSLAPSSRSGVLLLRLLVPLLRLLAQQATSRFPHLCAGSAPIGTMFIRSFLISCTCFSFPGLAAGQQDRNNILNYDTRA
mmetsp:Transcript_13600/g.29111  ORF Transcript_13600/g.29111 Transcript_13600/m.29111 type:complete len:269 (-) Transcript_13600:72-878(-)